MKNEMSGMERRYDRRAFCKKVGLGLGAAMLAAPWSQGSDVPKRRLKVGHTGITWGYKWENADQGIKMSAAWATTGTKPSESIFPTGTPKADWTRFWRRPRSRLSPL